MNPEIETRKADPVGISLRSNVIAAAGLALAAFSLSIFPALFSRPLTETAEARIAVVAREMLQSGNYILPTIDGKPRLKKPPLPYWTAVATAKVIGCDGTGDERMVFAVLFPQALAAALAVFIVSIYGALVFGRTAGIIAGMVLATSMLAAKFAQIGAGDTTLMFCAAGATCSAAWIVCQPRPEFVSAIKLGVFLALGILTKAHILPVILGAPLLAEVLIRRKFDSRKFLLVLIAIAVAAAIALPWYIMLEQQLPGALAAMRKEAAADMGHVQNDRFKYYIYRLAGGMLPWTAVLVAGFALYTKLKRKRSCESSSPDCSHARFLTLTFVLGFLIFYAWPKQQDYYLLPILPAFALLGGYVLSSFSKAGDRGEEYLAWSQLAIGALAATAALLWPVLAKQSADVSGATRWLAGAAGAAVMLALGLYCARQWAEGRALRAMLLFGAAAFLIVGIRSGLWLRSTLESTDIRDESRRIIAEIDALGEKLPVFSYGVPAPLASFYLHKPITRMPELAKFDRTGSGTQAVMVVWRKFIPDLNRKMRAEFSIPDDRNMLTIPLTNERDWTVLGKKAAGDDE